jgi:hypothetical protein
MINSHELTNRTAAIELTNRMRTHLRNERGSMADFLLDFAEFDRKQLWRELGYPAPFPYLRGEFKLSKSAAYQRLVAARLIQRYPEIEAAVRNVDLCLSSIHEVAKVLTPENVREVLPRFFGLSAREAAEVAVSLKPVEVMPIREVVTPVRLSPAVMRAVAAATLGLAATNRAPGNGEVRLAPGTARAVLTSEPPAPPAEVHVAGTAAAPAEVRTSEPEVRTTAVPSGELATPVPVPMAVVLQVVAELPRDSVEPLSAELSRLHLTVDKELLDLVEAAKDAFAHSCPSGRAVDVLKHTLRIALDQHDKRLGLVEKPLKQPRPSRDARHIPAHVRREVIRHAGGRRCEWILENGKRCECTRRLQFDHIQAVALGGKSTVENVRLVCRDHNLLAARRTFGDALMDRYAPGRANHAPGPVLLESLSLGLGGEVERSS